MAVMLFLLAGGIIVVVVIGPQCRVPGYCFTLLLLLPSLSLSWILLCTFSFMCIESLGLFYDCLCHPLASLGGQGRVVLVAVVMMVEVVVTVAIMLVV